jgi:hypothetical protein
MGVQQEQATAELRFLRFFYSAAGGAFGPADAEIYRMIIEDFEDQTGVRVPEDYREGFFSDEDDDNE